MKTTLFAMALAITAQTSAFADAPVETKSPAFSKGECSVAYIKTGEKASSYKIFKKEALTKLNQKLPNGNANELCSQELKADLKLSAETCQVYCNPN